jgi:hypothetical protein
MYKLVLAVALAAAVVIPSSWISDPAQAGHRWRHPHVWGDGDWEIIRWANGDCKIWHDDNGPPWGTDWVVLAENFRTWDAAWGGLQWFRARGRCL